MPKPASLLKGFEKAIVTAKPTAKRQVIFDEATTGLALIVTPKGKKSFSIVARNPAGKQVWKRIGDPALMTVAKARDEAAQAVARVKQGQAAVLLTKAVPDSFQQVAELFMRRWVDMGGKKQDGVPLRSKSQIERQLRMNVYPQWAALPFTSIRRGIVTALLDDISTNNGPVLADRVLATLNKMFNWYRQYDEEYVNPIIPEMRRSGTIADHARTRMLSDDDIRTVWAACDSAGTFGAFCKIALLTAQRRAKVASMKWTDLEDGVWTIPAEAREKVNAGSLQLPEMALEIIKSQPQIKGNPFVFAGRGDKAFNSFSKCKKRLDKTAPIEPWVLHDLRRTAKSLMARAGVRPDISERVLGHAIGGVEGVYDRYDYAAEKAEALEALAGLVARILAGEQGNVIQMADAAR